MWLGRLAQEVALRGLGVSPKKLRYVAWASRPSIAFTEGTPVLQDNTRLDLFENRVVFDREVHSVLDG